ncbi:MAG: DNA alkylation repair protein [Thermoleophilia bacterium]
MTSVVEVLARLDEKANPANLDGMARYGMTVDRRLGVAVPEMRRLAKEIGPDHALALDLWATGIAEARMVAGMIAVPDLLTASELESWVGDLDSWDVCDQLCMNLLERSSVARDMIDEWSRRDEEFVRRAAFALIACLAWHDKQAPDEVFLDYLPLIVRGSTDDRNYVKKAVSWALRTIGKRSRALNSAAIATAREIRQLDSRAARWIAADVLRELESEKTIARLKT